MSKVRKSVEYSIKDGICWANMVGFVEPYIVPFALHLNASNFLIGLMRSLPSLVSSFAQFFSEYLVIKFMSCKRVVYYSVIVQAFVVFFMAFTIYLNSWLARYIFLLLLIFYHFSGSTATAPWFTLMGEYLPSKTRGKFFGMRTQIVGVFFFISSFIAGYLLKNYPDREVELLFIFFLLASFFRFGSAYYINLMYEPDNRFHIPKRLTNISSFLNLVEIDPFIKKVLISVFILLFSVYIAAPYFSVYVLKELKFDYVRYMFLVSFGQVLTWVFAKYWGKFVDRYGSVKTLYYGMVFIPFISLFWMFSKNFWFLLFVEIFSGIVWGAFSIVYNTMIYEYVKPDERTRCMAYLIFVMSIAQFLGSIIGGFIYDKIKLPFSTFTLILGITTLGRFIALFYFKKCCIMKKEDKYDTKI